MLNSTRVDQKNIEGFIVAPMKKQIFLILTRCF